jgi:zinc/manganese transport system substrate-binding protein
LITIVSTVLIKVVCVLASLGAQRRMGTNMRARFIATFATLTAATVVLVGCAAPPPEGEAEAVAVVASTDVYGSIVFAIGGDLVDVTSIIDDTGKDPHEYEANGQNQLALSRADLVIENGGGYDDFVDTLLASSAKDGAVVLNVADLSGYDQDPADGEFNEHLWYDFPTVSKLAEEVVAQLRKADPENAETYVANGNALQDELSALESTEAQLKETSAGTGVAITEPVPLYMLDAIGLVNRTPSEFSEAIEEGRDAPPGILRDTLDLFSNGSVGILAYNEQTNGPQTEEVVAAAQANGIAVVPVTETLPEGKTYIQWMQDNVAAIAAALGS